MNPGPLTAWLEETFSTASPETSHRRQTGVHEGGERKFQAGVFALCLVFSAPSEFPWAPWESEPCEEGGFLEQFLFLSSTQAPLSRLI